MKKTLATSLCKWLLTVFVTCVAFSATANDHITARGYWEDKTAQATFEEAQAQQYTAFDGVLSRGYTQSATWIRLTITPPAGEDELVLRIRPVYLDEITLYDPLDTSGKPRKVGDTTSYMDNEYRSLSHTFKITAGSQQRDVWLRLVSTSTSLIDIEAFTHEEMLDSEFNLLLFYASVLAVVMIFMLMVLINWLNFRDYLSGFFVIRQAYYFIYTATLFGFHRYYLSGLMSPSSLDLLYSLMVVCAVAVTFTFEYQFLNEYSPPKWAKAVLCFLIIWSAVVLTLLLAGYEFLALKYTMVLNAVGAFTLLMVAVICIDDKKSQANKTASLLQKRVVVVYYLSINLVMVLAALPALGVLKGNLYALNGLVLYTFASGLIMTVLMLVRASQIRKAKSASEKELLLSKQEIELEKNRREEQSHLLHMLMHELKNPMAIIDMAMLAKNDFQATKSDVHDAVGSMKSILERCVNADKLTEGNVAVHIERVNVSELLCDLLVAGGHDPSRVALDVADELAVQTDVQYFQIMCSNLIDNAVRYGDPLMPVLIQAQRQKNEAQQLGVCITVSNRPSEASWPDPEKVFTKYYRSASAEGQSGTGLGLHLVRTLARLVGGDCVYAPDETNIRFKLWLPS